MALVPYAQVGDCWLEEATGSTPQTSPADMAIGYRERKPAEGRPHCNTLK